MNSDQFDDFCDDVEGILARNRHKSEATQIVNVTALVAKYILHMERRIMADLTALKQAVADNAAATDAVVIKIDELKAAIANIPADNQPEVDAVVADLTATIERLKAAVA